MKTNTENALDHWKSQIDLMGTNTIPLIGFVSPLLTVLNDKTSKVKIQLNNQTKNHVNSLYFGAMAVGADVAGGVHAFHYAEQYNKTPSFAFKSVNSEFVLRAESDCTFVCNDGLKVKAAVIRSIDTGERVNETVYVSVFNNAMEVVAMYEMVISVNCK